MPGANLSGECDAGSKLAPSKRSGLETNGLPINNAAVAAFKLFLGMSRVSIHAMLLVPQSRGSGSPLAMSIVRIVPALFLLQAAFFGISGTTDAPPRLWASRISSSGAAGANNRQIYTVNASEAYHSQWLAARWIR